MLLRIFFLLFFYAANICKGQIPKQGLSLWLRADAGVETDSNKVIAWADQSGHHHDARVKTNKSPVWIKQALNNLPVIRFNGFDNGLETTPMATFPYKRGTVIIVVNYLDRNITSGVGHGSIVGTYHGKRTKDVWQFGAYGDKFAFYDGISGHLNHVAPQTMKSWEMISIVRTGDSIMTSYGGGRKQGEFVVRNMIPDTNTVKIGFNGKLTEDSIPEVLNGDIAEIIIYDRDLNTAELNTVHHYLSKKYGLSLAPPPVWQRGWFYFLLVIIALFIGAAISRFISARKFKKQLAELKQQAAVEAERYRISRDMHDEIGSGLTHIALMSELMQTQKKAEEELRKDVGYISTSARKLVESMSEIIWALNPQNDSLENLLAYLREQTINYFEPFSINYAVHFPIVVPNMHLTNEQRRNLFLVAKEALNNALKHSGANRISLNLEITDDHLHFSVRDNGKGLEATKIKAGANGLKNMERRMQDIGGHFEIVTNDTGTLIHFWMKQAEALKLNTTYFTLRKKT